MPSVVCVMVTQAGRERLARAAVACFRRQTWTSKNLLIVNTGPPVLGEPEVGERELIVEQGSLKLSDLRNLVLEHVNPGNWICQWDDDDYSAPERIEQQMDLLEETKKRCCVLRAQIRLDINTEEWKTVLWAKNDPLPGIPGTVLFLHGDARYRAGQPKHEDSQFLHDCFSGDVAVLENTAYPELYVRFFHGGNTWDRNHFFGDEPPFLPSEMPSARRRRIAAAVSLFRG